MEFFCQFHGKMVKFQLNFWPKSGLHSGRFKTTSVEVDALIYVNRQQTLASILSLSWSFLRSSSQMPVILMHMNPPLPILGTMFSIWKREIPQQYKEGNYEGGAPFKTILRVLLQLCSITSSSCARWWVETHLYVIIIKYQNDLRLVSHSSPRGPMKFSIIVAAAAS